MSHVKKLAPSKYQARHRAQTGGSTRGTSDRKRDADYWLAEEARRVRRGSWTHPKAGTLEEWSATYLGDLHVKGATARLGPLAWHSPASVWPVALSQHSTEA